MKLEEFLQLANAKAETYHEFNAGIFEDFLEWLRELLQPLNMRFMYEPPAAIDNTKLRDKYPDVALPRRARFILKSDRNQSNFKHELCRMGNGLVFVIEEGVKKGRSLSAYQYSDKVRVRLAAVPASDFGRESTTEEMDRLINSGVYTAYEIKDGTVVSLWYDSGHIFEKGGSLQQGLWFVGSKSHFNVEFHSWRGFEYHEILTDLWRQYPNFSWDKLDKECTYTIRFLHPAYHPFDQPAAWKTGMKLTDQKFRYELELIRCTHTPTRKLSQPDIGIPIAKPVKVSNWHSLKEQCNFALQNFMCGLTNRQMTPGVPVQQTYSLNPKAPIHFGYIFRDEQTFEHPDVMLPSDLWNEIAGLLYDPPNLREMGTQNKTHYLRDVRFIVLGDYMRSLVHKNFEHLLPAYYPIYKTYDNISWVVTDLICDSLTGSDRFGNRPDAKEWTGLLPHLQDLARRFADIIKNQMRLTITHLNKLSKPGSKDHAKQLEDMKRERELIHNLIFFDTKNVIMIYEALHGPLPKTNDHPEDERANIPPLLRNMVRAGAKPVVTEAEPARKPRATRGKK